MLIICNSKVIKIIDKFLCFSFFNFGLLEQPFYRDEITRDQCVTMKSTVHTVCRHNILIGRK